MQHDEGVLAMFRSFLPKLRPEEQSFLDALPEEYYVDVPYFAQEQLHWSGAAVAQMLRAFHEKVEIPQSVIAHEAGFDEWRSFNHETLKEDFVRYMAKRGYVPSLYYPGRYVLPQFKTGVEGADFIACNYELVNDVGFSYFKALLVSSGAPVCIRVHFNTSMYPMSEEMASILDSCGHGLVIVGYNSKGFIVHDPWNRDSWGGTHGGKDQFISYHELASRPSVNCCLGCVESYVPLSVEIDYPRRAIHQNRSLELVLKVGVPGIHGITSDIYPLFDAAAEIKVGAPLSVKGSTVRKLSDAAVLGGSNHEFAWTIDTGPQKGSFPVEATFRVSVKIPAFQWEGNVNTEVITLRAKARRRLDVKDIEWLNRYGREK